MYKMGNVVVEMKERVETSTHTYLCDPPGSDSWRGCWEQPSP